MAGKRTTHRSTAGKKLYAVRDAKGRFTDIQTYERAHRADLKKNAKTETSKKATAAKAKSKATTKAKPVAKKAAPKKVVAKKK